MHRILMALVACAALASPSCAAASKPTRAQLQHEVMDTERAFAKTMADRDHAAFTRFVSREAVFFGGAKPLRGRAAVSAAWKRFFDKPDAPFSWEPETVEVLDSGTLALSSGPVHDPLGKVIATFTSIWRRDAPGSWHIVFDKGCDVCEEKKAK